MRIEPVFLFDLDGTLVDSVYQHVLAWKEALDAEGVELLVWRIHRKIGMSEGLFTNQLLRETGIEISIERVERLRRAYAAAYQQQINRIRPLPGARELLSWLSEAGIPWAIATSGRMETAAVNLASLGVDPGGIPVVTRDQVKHAKPDADLFLAVAERLGAPIETAVVVGESSWDMLAAIRFPALGVGLLSGGYGPDELRQSGAFPRLRGSGRPAAPHRRSRKSALKKPNMTAASSVTPSDLRRACVRVDRNGLLGLAVVAPVWLVECVRHARGIGCGPVDPAARGHVLEQACTPDRW
jgi:phosphoglycolate phosphatase-like HAD superfamily hydrolase